MKAELDSLRAQIINKEDDVISLTLLNEELSVIFIINIFLYQ